MLATVFAPAASLEAELVEIQCDILGGLPALVVVGLGDKAVDEARERMRSAIKNSALNLPQRRLTLNLAPANLPKDGTGYDLGMAVAILVASEQIAAERVEQSVFLGELALDGSLREVRGVLAGAQSAAEQGYKRLYVAANSAEEAAMVGDLEVYPVRDLQQLYLHLTGTRLIEPVPADRPTGTRSPAAIDLAQIAGQDQAKRALEIAAAGNHNLLLSGPPGVGKTMLAKALIGLMPPPSLEEITEITKIHSLAYDRAGAGIVTHRPFRAPHHTASSAALIGGGTFPRPGEISLSHRGILFLDELPEFPRSILEMLRQPLEDGDIRVARVQGSVSFPANFLLVATQNPCPCGYAGDPVKPCVCSQGHIERYRRKISGPLLDRIDLFVDVPRVDHRQLAEAEATGVGTAEAARRVESARKMRLKRESAKKSQVAATITPEGLTLLQDAAGRLNLSGRGYFRTIGVARTIADLEGSDEIKPNHLTEALHYRARV